MPFPAPNGTQFLNIQSPIPLISIRTATNNALWVYNYDDGNRDKPE